MPDSLTACAFRLSLQVVVIGLDGEVKQVRHNIVYSPGWRTATTHLSILPRYLLFLRPKEEFHVLGLRLTMLWPADYHETDRRRVRLRGGQ